MTKVETINRVAAPVSRVTPPAGIETAAESSTAGATSMTFVAAPQAVWDCLMFYEQIAKRPPFLLRWLLPRPLRVEGRKSQAGDVATCVYDSGSLLKRVTYVDEPRQYEFDIVKQTLYLGGGLELLGGCYSLTALPGGGTRVVLTTRYSGGRRPRWLARPIEAAVCHAFHRYVLRSIRIALATSGSQRKSERTE